VHPSALQEAGASAEGADLLVLDSIFPFAMVRQLQQSSGAPAVVGGHNALQHALRGPGAWAIVGPGRQALLALAAGAEPLSVPGVWERGGDGVLRCGPPTGSAASQLMPFDPFLDWSYFGPPRAPGSNLRVPSIVADFGCPWNRSVLADGGPYAGVLPRLPDVPLGPEAARQLQETFVGREGGCTFCALRFTPYVRSAAVPQLLAQADVLIGRGARGLSLQTEHPLPILAPLLEGLAERGLDELHIRTIPWLVLRHQGLLEAAIARAKRSGIRLVLAQVGFEAFDDGTLAVYHKGLDAAENRRAARLLGDLTAAHEGFLGTGGHGLVPLHPWTTPGGLRETLEACRADAPWLLPQLTPASRIELYDEYCPLFWKAWDEGLVSPNPATFGWDWTFAHAATGEAVAAWGAIRAEVQDPRPTAASEILDGVLSVLEHQPDPDARRNQYLALREQARRSRFSLRASGPPA
jgi:hypothetical protein